MVKVTPSGPIPVITLPSPPLLLSSGVIDAPSEI